MSESLEVQLARIEEKLDRALLDIKENRSEVNDEIADLRKRLETLERWRAALIGGSAAVGAIAGKIWDLLQH